MQQAAFEGAKQNECLEDAALQDGRRPTGRSAGDGRSASPVESSYACGEKSY